jgi:hypothetical protein
LDLAEEIEDQPPKKETVFGARIIDDRIKPCDRLGSGLRGN